MKRKYSELKSIRVKSSPLRSKELPKSPAIDLRGKPCGVGQTRERDGCIPNSGEDEQQPKQQSDEAQQWRPVKIEPYHPDATTPKPKPISGSAVAMHPETGKLHFDPSKIQEQSKPSEEQVLSGGKQSTNKWEPAAAKFNDKMSVIDQKAWDEVMPEGMTKESCALLTGIDPENPNAYVSAGAKYLGGKPIVTIRISDQTVGLRMDRKIKPGGIVLNESFLIDEDFQGQGIGTEIFSRQVEVLAKAGMKKIQCTAQRDEDCNGYYTWPRLGYDADIEERITDHELKDKIKSAFPEAKTIQDLYKTKEGREWWKENGDTVGMDFDLKKGSQSRKILAAYLEEKKNQKKRLTLMRTKRLH